VNSPCGFQTSGKGTRAGRVGPPWQMGWTAGSERSQSRGPILSGCIHSYSDEGRI
jgi:hypothetical protein